MHASQLLSIYFASLAISWKSIKLDTAIPLKYIVTPNHATILHHRYEIPIPRLTPLKMASQQIHVILRIFDTPPANSL